MPPENVLLRDEIRQTESKDWVRRQFRLQIQVQDGRHGNPGGVLRYLKSSGAVHWTRPLGIHDFLIEKIQVRNQGGEEATVLNNGGGSIENPVSDHVIRRALQARHVREIG